MCHCFWTQEILPLAPTVRANGSRQPKNWWHRCSMLTKERKICQSGPDGPKEHQKLKDFGIAKVSNLFFPFFSQKVTDAPCIFIDIKLHSFIDRFELALVLTKSRFCRCSRSWWCWKIVEFKAAPGWAFTVTFKTAQCKLRLHFCSSSSQHLCVQT